LHLVLKDNFEQEIFSFFDKAVNYIEKNLSQKEYVFVHCVQGVSRSATLVTAYVMKHNKLTVKEALAFIRERRSCVSPNRGFLYQLLTWEKILFPNNSENPSVKLAPFWTGSEPMFSVEPSEHTYEPLSEIMDGLYLCGVAATKNLDELNKRNVKSILTVTDSLTPHIDTNVYKQLRIAVLDSPSTDMHVHFKETNEFIDAAFKDGHSVAVHCTAGVSRSATVVIAYVMQKNKISYDNAFKLVQEKRQYVDPNCGFKEQLRRYQAELKIDD